MTVATQTYHVWHWLIYKEHIDIAFFGWLVGTVMTAVFGTLILKPSINKLKEAYRGHERTQRDIADRLDPQTPGGLQEVVEAVRAIQQAQDH